jgi:hypothetical protein
MKEIPENFLALFSSCEETAGRLWSFIQKKALIRPLP